MNAPRSIATTLASVLAACVVAVPVAAHAQYIDLPGTQPHDLDTAAPLDSASSCGLTCHFSGDATTPSAMPYDDYIGSMMGNTMQDPLFLAALTVAEQDRAGVGDWCLRCHTPPGFVGGRTRSSATAALGTDLNSSDMEGVTCDSCHRSQPTTNLGNAQYVLSPTETRFGPYDTIDSIRHPGAASDWFDQSEQCGTCHEIWNPTQPLLRADGTDTGLRFPLDTTYSEWANSDFAVAGSANEKICQDCHMPDWSGQTYVATNTTAMLRDSPGQHFFAGPNAWGLRVLETMRGDPASGEFYDPTMVPFYEAGARRSEDLLRSALTIEMLAAPSTATPGAQVQVSARVTNNAGHRVPSGFADARRVWLTVELVDADGHVTPVSGTYDDTTAALDETDPQLHVYEAVHGRSGTGADNHLALSNTIVRDTRLPPAGFHPPPGLEPVGVDYSGGPGGSLRNWDDVNYHVTIPPTASGMLTVRVRARYQTTTHDYVEFLASENHTDQRGNDLRTRYEASSRDAPFEMAVASAQINVMPVAVDAGTDAANTDAAVDGGMRDEGMPRGGGCGCRTAGDANSRAGLVWLVGFVAVVVGRRRRRPVTN